MNNKIYLGLILLTGYIIPTLAWSANICTTSGNAISDTSWCTATPDTYTVYIYKTGLCNNIDPSSAALPDMAANCITTFDSGASPLEISVINNVSQPITGGTISRPPNNTYTHGFVLLAKALDIKTSKTFTSDQTGSAGGTGPICWTMNGISGPTPHTKCGTSVDSNTYGVTSTNVEDLNPNGNDPTCTDHFHCSYVEAPYDTTYAYVLNGNVKATSGSPVTRFAGFATFTTPVTVNDASTAMDLKFRVTQGVSVSFSRGIDLYTSVFKTITAIH